MGAKRNDLRLHREHGSLMNRPEPPFLKGTVPTRVWGQSLHTRVGTVPLHCGFVHNRGVRVFRRIKDPVEGTAQVVSHTQWTGGTSQNIDMTLVVQAIGIEPFTLRHKCMCRADKWPHAGQTLPVTFDREHTDRLDVDWDRVPSGKESAMQSAEALRDALAQGGTSLPTAGGFAHVETKVIDLSDDPAARAQVIGSVEGMLGQDIDGDGRIGGAPAGDERIGELERLVKLRDSGALTQEEFETEKRRVLGS
jgi:Short C-terminal domain